MMEPIPIQLTERAKLDRQDAHVRFGAPLRKGSVTSPDRLVLTSDSNSVVAADFSPLLIWPDGSLRWVQVDAIVPAEARRGLRIQLGQAQSSSAADAPSMLDHKGRNIDIITDGGTLRVDRNALRWRLLRETDPGEAYLAFTDGKNRACIEELSNGGWKVRRSGKVSSVLIAEGNWLDVSQRPLVRFQCELTVYRDGRVTVQVCIHNPRRARHPGGLWDLGDEGSIHFGSLSIEVRQADAEKIRLRLAPQQEDHVLAADQPFLLLQESSGGDNWDSRNHINASGDLIPRFRGYTLYGNCIDTINGERASPTLEYGSDKKSRLSAAMPGFWQNFPSALSVHHGGLSLQLFPGNRAEPYELQGGERKTQCVVLGYGQSLEAMADVYSLEVPVIPAKHYETSHALPWFRAHVEKSDLDRLIGRGLEGEYNFFDKREQIDEYGWRNFGDIFADHETLYQKTGESPYISHYNNQYDAIYGFVRQFALSGDSRWFELMDDLARHVTDIDIYHTDEDRAEYNHGLFWHTDHYLDAHTCTHRTFTRHNSTSSTPGQLGGGPAAEHCYTTGLLYHYLLTGAPASREAVLELARWMQSVHKGGKGLLAQILAVKKQELPKLRALLRGERVNPHRFPFTRGTGNYLNTLLDAYLLEHGGGWLEEAESVIRQTIHPADDIVQRDLLDTEIGWSYLVLLSSVVRYLHIKEETGVKDDAWQFAKDSFLHYSKWMLHNERPFLADTAELEFANETWTAQDVRKAMLMFLAAVYDPSLANQYRQKADEWLSYVTTRLFSSPEHHYTRIQVILLQNYGPHLLDPGSYPHRLEDLNESPHYRTPSLNWPALLGQIAAKVFRGLINFRPSQEKAWLQARLDR